MSGYIYNIGQLFKRVAIDNADRIAVRHISGEVCTYAHLDELSDMIVAYYKRVGLGKGDVIALFNNKSTLGFACMLASLKLGTIYTNLDINSPYE
ncbi:MAG: hypothetical protein K8F30_06065, partial [Taibaiella sp.]|nr:hypothetical protein [Taibaiella sp.]